MVALENARTSSEVWCEVVELCCEVTIGHNPGEPPVALPEDGAVLCPNLTVRARGWSS